MIRRSTLDTTFAVLAVVIVLVLLLSGCGGGVYQSSGKPAPAPEGFSQLCRDQPEFPSCQPAKN